MRAASPPTWPSTLRLAFTILRAAELDRLERLETIRADDDEWIALVGAAVVVLEAVDRLGLVRALVLDVGNAVVIVVGIRAAVEILEAVLVLGLVRALVARCRGCRRRRCRGRDSRRRPGSRRSPRDRAGTCRRRRGCRRRRCRDRDSRPRPRTCRCPRARRGTCRCYPGCRRRRGRRRSRGSRGGSARAPASPATNVIANTPRRSGAPSPVGDAAADREPSVSRRSSDS